MSLEYPDAPNVVRLPKAFKPHAIDAERSSMRSLAELARVYGDAQNHLTQEIIAQVIGLAEQCQALAAKVKGPPYHKVALGVGLSDAAADLETLAALHTPMETIND